MVYYSPEDDYLPQQNPKYNDKQAPPLGYKEDDGVFQKRVIQSQWVEGGTTARFQFSVNHVLDGAITPSPLPVLAILDRYGNPYTLGTTIGTVTLLPGTQNTYYADVQFSGAVQAGDYISSWSATYTPLAAGSVSLLIGMRRAFKIKATMAPSPYFFWDNSKTAQS